MKRRTARSDRRQQLATLTKAQWEALCDGCGRCCLHKRQNATTGKVSYTWVACRLLDTETCRCTRYDQRHQLVPDCVQLNPESIARMKWLPRTCAYRLTAEGRPLPDWHPLVSGDTETVHQEGISVRHRAVPETCVHPDDIELFLIEEMP